MMAGGTRALSCRGILAPQKMQKVRRLQFHRAISLARFVDQKRKGDARFFTKYSRIIAVAHSDRGKGGSFVAESLLVFAQLRDVLAAKDSPIVPEKNQHGRLRGPQRAKKNLLPIAIGKSDLCEPAAEGFFHAFPILGRAYRTVKRSASGPAHGFPVVFRILLSSSTAQPQVNL
jgi:hypothetical protein